MNAAEVATTLQRMPPIGIAAFYRAVAEVLMFGLASQMAVRDVAVSARTLDELQACYALRANGPMGDIAAVRRLEGLIRGGTPMLDAVYHLAAEGLIENADPTDGWGA